MTLVLVVDDVPAMVQQYAYDLGRMGYQVITAPDGRKALEILGREPVDCVVLDLELPGLDGFAVLKEMKQQGIVTPVIVYTGTGDFARCVQAIRLGAFTFVDKAEPVERVVQEIENAMERSRLVEQVGRLRQRLDGERPLIGDGPAMRRVRELIARVAPIPSPVLITGESGTGKELIARELHRLGPGGPDAPFIAVNSAALPEQLVESELFGHERGAFTGAATLRKGAFESAGRGTLFLDEIGELPGAAQAKLLRVLEERTVTRLGGSRAVPVEARVVAATNRDLDVEVKEKRFREDLLFRLNVHQVRVPPLRERSGDIPALAQGFIASLAPRLGVRPKQLDRGALDLLTRYDWHRNNVRELRNVIERMLIAADGEVLTAADVPVELQVEGGAAGGSGTSFQEQRTAAERDIVRAALERNEWHITRTAKELGLADHASLLKVMRRLGVTRGSRD